MLPLNGPCPLANLRRVVHTAYVFLEAPWSRVWWARRGTLMHVLNASGHAHVCAERVSFCSSCWRNKVLRCAGVASMSQGSLIQVNAMTPVMDYLTGCKGDAQLTFFRSESACYSMFATNWVRLNFQATSMSAGAVETQTSAEVPTAGDMLCHTYLVISAPAIANVTTDAIDLNGGSGESAVGPALTRVFIQSCDRDVRYSALTYTNVIVDFRQLVAHVADQGVPRRRRLCGRHDRCVPVRVFPHGQVALRHTGQGHGHDCGHACPPDQATQRTPHPPHISSMSCSARHDFSKWSAYRPLARRPGAGASAAVWSLFFQPVRETHPPISTPSSTVVPRSPSRVKPCLRVR